MSKRLPGVSLTELMSVQSSADEAVRSAGRSEEKKAHYQRSKFKDAEKGEARKLLEELKPRDLDIITMYLTGVHRQNEIAATFGCTQQTVSRVINDPLSQNIINSYLAGVAADFKAMATLVNDAIRAGLLSNNATTSLRAVDRYVKILSIQQGTTESLTHNLKKKEQTENDVISRLQKMRENMQKSGVEEVIDVSDAGQIPTPT